MQTKNFQMFKLALKKGRGMRYQIANIHWIIEKGEFQKNIYFGFIDSARAFDCESQQTVENSRKGCTQVIGMVWEQHTLDAAGSRGPALAWKLSLCCILTPLLCFAGS